jgi:hypothetical protein
MPGAVVKADGVGRRAGRIVKQQQKNLTCMPGIEGEIDAAVLHGCAERIELSSCYVSAGFVCQLTCHKNFPDGVRWTAMRLENTPLNRYNRKTFNRQALLPDRAY